MPMPVSRTANVTASVSSVIGSPDPHLAPFGEFDRVRDQVAQDLRQLALVLQQGRDIGRVFEDQRHAVADQQWAQHAAQGREQPLGAALDRGHDDLAGLDLGEVEEVVDELGQALGGLADELDLALLLRRQFAVGASEQQAGQAPGSS